jgi:hypothetical protein
MHIHTFELRETIVHAWSVVRNTISSLSHRVNILLILYSFLLSGITIYSYQSISQMHSLSITSEIENSKLNEVNLLSESIAILTSQISKSSATTDSSVMELLKAIDSLHSKKIALLESIELPETDIQLYTALIAEKSLFFLLFLLNLGLLLMVIQISSRNTKKDEKAYKSIFFNQIEKSIDINKSNAPTASYETPGLLFKFYEALKEGSSLPFLHGRDKTAEKIGISSAQAKRIVANLIELNLIEVAGKRLRLKS